MNIIKWLLLVVGIKAQDKCSHLAGQTIISYDEALDCYQSIPLSKRDQVNQINTLIKTLSFYVFLDITQNSPEPKIPSYNNLIEQLLEIQNRNYTNGFEFHKDIYFVFLNNQDGHFTYSSRCFEQFVFRQPFPLMAAENVNGKQTIRVVPKLIIPPVFQEYWSNFGIDVMKYAGQVVQSINSWPSLNYLQSYSDKEIGVSRDFNARLSLSLAHPMYVNGKWGITNGLHAVTDFPPNSNGINYTFRNKTHIYNLRVPHLVTVSPEFQPGMNYFNEFCKPKINNPNNSKGNQLSYMEAPRMINMKIHSELPQLSGNRMERGIDSPLLKLNYAHTYRVAKDAGVLAIPSFSSYDINGYYWQIQYALNSVKNFTKLILDFSNNGGGVICLGYHLLDTLIFNKTKTRFPTDLRLSPLLIELIKRSENTNTFMDPKYWRKPDGSNFQDATEFLKEMKFRQGNNYQSFSQSFIDNCPPNPLIRFRDYSNTTLAIVSNGICFSTCALVVNALQEFYNIKSYVVGGDESRPAAAATLAGGTIFSLGTLMAHLQSTGLSNHPDAPPPLAIDARVTFTMREAYSSSTQSYFYQNGRLTNTSPRPLEFTWLPATYHIPSNDQNFHDPSLVWRQIAKDMENY